MTPEEVIKHFIVSAKKAMSTMCGIKDVQKKKLYINKEAEAFGSISGVMGLSGATASTPAGSFVLSFPDKLATKLASNMLCTDPSELGVEDIEDAIGEIVNLVSGQAKKLLADTKFAFSISVPTVISGERHRISWQETSPCICVLIEADGEEFAMYLSLAKMKRNT